MRIDQMLPDYAHFDAIGSHTQTIQALLRARGYESEIFVENERAGQRDKTRGFRDYRYVSSKENILLYHHSIGSQIPNYLATTNDFTVCIYHNVTPFYFFDSGSEVEARDACLRGRMQNYIMKIRANFFWHDSAYNASEFATEGHFAILPILRKYHYLSSHKDDADLKNSIKSPKKTLLFVGKLMRHKSQHDLLLMLKLYQDFYDTPARLILVGNGPQTYFDVIKRLGQEFGLAVGINQPHMDADVHIFTTCSDPQLATIYRSADAFVCLSEHEGFCVPLVEAMTFGLPIIGNNSSAIPETCGPGATIVSKDNFPELLDGIHKLFTEEKYHHERAQASLNRAKDFADSNLEVIFDSVLEKTLQRKKIFDAKVIENDR